MERKEEFYTFRKEIDWKIGRNGAEGFLEFAKSREKLIVSLDQQLYLFN